MDNFAFEPRRSLSILDAEHPLATVTLDAVIEFEQMLSVATPDTLNEAWHQMESLEAFQPIIAMNPDRHLYAVLNPTPQEVAERLRFGYIQWLLKIVQQYDRGHIGYEIASVAIKETLAGTRFSFNFLEWPDL